MGKITQLGDFENLNHYKIVILKIKIEIITNYEFLKSKFCSNQVILKIIFKITFELAMSFFHYSYSYNNFI